MREPDTATCRTAHLTLFYGMAVEQQAHGAGFLVRELERLYISGRCTPPAWIGELRYEFTRRFRAPPK